MPSKTTQTAVTKLVIREVIFIRLELTPLRCSGEYSIRKDIGDNTSSSDDDPRPAEKDDSPQSRFG